MEKDSEHSPPTGSQLLRRGIARKAIFAAVLAGGAAIGAGLFTFTYARGASYLTDDPAACANCHIMQEQYDGWIAGSHTSAAGCNDCHTPPGFVAKYLSKFENGWRHSFAFTTGRFADPIQIHGRNLEIANRACVGCHQSQFHESADLYGDSAGIQCTHCHRGVGHDAQPSSGAALFAPQPFNTQSRNVVP
ncbi:MAG: cytochrome c nitrite reductase small subunit [Leptospirales bacterium]|jgi:cytochrome c nitrite reductase small subunit